MHNVYCQIRSLFIFRWSDVDQRGKKCLCSYIYDICIGIASFVLKMSNWESEKLWSQLFSEEGASRKRSASSPGIMSLHCDDAIDYTLSKKVKTSRMDEHFLDQHSRSPSPVLSPLMPLSQKSPPPVMSPTLDTFGDHGRGISRPPPRRHASNPHLSSSDGAMFTDSNFNNKENRNPGVEYLYSRGQKFVSKPLDGLDGHDIKKDGIGVFYGKYCSLLFLAR